MEMCLGRGRVVLFLATDRGRCPHAIGVLFTRNDAFEWAAHTQARTRALSGPSAGLAVTWEERNYTFCLYQTCEQSSILILTFFFRIAGTRQRNAGTLRGSRLKDRQAVNEAEISNNWPSSSPI